MSLRLKVMSYNILDGFHSPNRPYVFQPERLDAAKSIVANQNPAVLVLAETCEDSVTKHGIKIDYAKEFGFRHSFIAPKPQGSRHGITLLSNMLFSAVNYSMHQQQFVRAYFGDQKFCLDALHPHPDLNENSRAQFFKNVLRDGSRYHILVGDLNSWSPHDIEYIDRNKAISTFSSFQQLKDLPLDKIAELIDDKLSTNALKTLEREGFIDTYRAKNPKGHAYTVPTNLLSKDKGAATRLDYIFCSTNIKVVDADIIRGEETEIASDHYPVTATIEIP